MGYGYLLATQRLFDACFESETDLRRDIAEIVALVEGYIIRTFAVGPDVLEVTKREMLEPFGTPAEVQAACRGEGPSPLRSGVFGLQLRFAADPARFREDIARERDQLRDRMTAPSGQPPQGR